MYRIERISILTIILLSLFISSNIAIAQNAISPEDMNIRTDEIDTIVFDDGTSAEMLVEGNTTIITLDDGTEIRTSANDTVTSVIITFDDIKTEISYGKLPVTLPVYPGSEYANNAYPTDQSVMSLKETNTISKIVETDMVSMSLSDPVEGTSMFRMFGKSPQRQLLSEFPTDSFFDIFYEVDKDNSSFSFFSGNPFNPVSPTDPVNGMLITTDFNITSDPNNLGVFRMGLNDISYVLGSYNVQANLLSNYNIDGINGDSFFDLDYNITGINPQQYQIAANNNYINQQNDISWTNLTDGDNRQATHIDGDAPIADRWPLLGEPTVPNEVFDVILTDDYVGLTVGSLSIILFIDKLIINYHTLSGYYVPIILYFILKEVVIIYEYVTIIMYLEIIELVTVIIIYEIIKIEVYIEYMVIVYETIITLIEIYIYFIEISIYYIEVNITINLWVFQIIFVFINIIILPVWIIIIPIIINRVKFIFVPFPVFIPIFIPIIVPVLIPVPTPVPIVLPKTDIDIFSQTFNEDNNKMDLSYNVTDEYDLPISGANVTVEVNGFTYQATEDTVLDGIYSVKGIPYTPNATIDVTAKILYRPIGRLLYDQKKLDLAITSPPTVTQYNTTTVTDISTITSIMTNNNSSGSSPVPVSTFALLSGMFVFTIITNIIRRKKINVNSK